MLKAELKTTCTTGIGTSDSTRFTVLLVLRNQHYIRTKLDIVWMAK